MIKSVAITGSSGTLGRACVSKFAAGGWKVHPSPPSKKCNVAFWLDICEEWMDKIGHVDALVTAAGISCVKPTLELKPSEWEYVIAVNLTGTFFAAVEAIKRGATRIVTIGSIHGCTRTTYAQRAAYTASKAGVMGLTEALAVEFAPEGVAVNCVAPGHLPKLMPGTSSGQALLDAAAKRTPAGRLVTPVEVADVIFWLCNDAPLTLTGQTIVVSGGFEINTYPL